ncbi:MAG: hypothetical protein D6814_12015, partial [Calditrichaeota bacterium]
LSLKEELQALEQKEKTITRDLQQSEYYALEKLLARYEKLSHRKQELEAQLEKLGEPAHIPTSNREVVIRLMEERKLLHQERHRFYQELRELNEEKRKVRTELEALPPEQDFWQNSKFAEFFSLAERWENLQARAAEIQQSQREIQAKLEQIGIDEPTEEQIKNLKTTELEDRQKQAAELKQKEQELAMEKAKIQQRRRYFNFGRFAVGVVSLTLFILAILSQLTSFSAATSNPFLGWLDILKFLALPLALVWIFMEIAFARSMRLWQDNVDYERQLMRMEENELREFLAPFGVDSIDQLLILLQRYGELRNLKTSEFTQVEEMKQVEKNLQPWLEAFQRDHISLENLKQLDQLIREGIQLHQSLQDLDKKIKFLEIELATRDSRIDEIETRLQGIFQSANCWTGDLEADAATFFKRMEQMQKYDTLMQEWDQLVALEQEMLKGQKIEHLYERRETLQEALSGQSVPTNLPPQSELKKVLEEVQKQKQQLQIELAGLQERTAERESKLPDLSELEEQKAQNERALANLTRHRQALELAYETLSEVARETHKNFAPKLAHSLSNQLAELTRNRYRECYIDPSSFSIRIAHDAAQTLVPLEQLSLGTQEQIYILLRSALATLFSAQGESIPLFLDDPLVHADETRQFNMLKLLMRLARKHQLFYFTKDQSIIDTLAVLRTEYNLITLMTEEQPAMVHRWAAGTAFQNPGIKDTNDSAGQEEV